MLPQVCIYYFPFSEQSIIAIKQGHILQPEPRASAILSQTLSFDFGVLQLPGIQVFLGMDTQVLWPVVVSAGEQGLMFLFGKQAFASNRVQSALQFGEQEQWRGLGLVHGDGCAKWGGNPYCPGPRGHLSCRGGISPLALW